MRIHAVLPPLHPGQQQVADHPARFKVVCAGRRWGKTLLGAAMCLKAAAGGGRVWWVAPTYAISAIAWRALKNLAVQLKDGSGRLLPVIRESDRVISLPGGGWVQIKSADNPDALRGEGLDFLVIDEAAYVREDAWTGALRPALSDRRGGALLISTPSGRTWFWRAYLLGQPGADPAWQAWHFPTASNPGIDPAELEAARGLLPEAVYRQEYLAEFIDAEQGVFRGVRSAIRPPPEGPRAGGRYVMGVDWGQITDFTALAVLEAHSGQLVALNRFQQVGWAVQRDRLVALAHKWNVGRIVAEANSIGGPNIEALQAEGLPVEGFYATGASKAALIQALQGAFERGQISILDDPTLISELEAFSAERLPSGAWRYSAPPGLHDDTVIALALAWRAAQDQPGPAGGFMRQIAVKGRAKFSP